MLITTVVATIFVFGLLIFVHEFGHFITAKAVGMRVDEFAIGFGPQIVSKKHGETIYSWRLIPLGGFNKIAGMDPDEEQDERSFNRKPIWARMLVIVAGSVMNFLLPVLLLAIVFASIGIDKPTETPVVGQVFPGKPAAQAGLTPGDVIMAVDGQPAASWMDFVRTIQTHKDAPLTIQVQRQNRLLNITMMPEYDARNQRAIIGVMPEIVHYQPGVGEAVWLAAQQSYIIIKLMIISIYQMLAGQIAADVAGPIGVAQMAGQAAQLGIWPLLQFAAFVSLNLGLINLLPVPVLDGGHIVTLAVEGVRGKPLRPESMQVIQMIGLALLLLLVIVATFKDITRIKAF